MIRKREIRKPNVENFGKIFRKKLLNAEIFGNFRKKREDPSFQKA